MKEGGRRKKKEGIKEIDERRSGSSQRKDERK